MRTLLGSKSARLSAFCAVSLLSSSLLPAATFELSKATIPDIHAAVDAGALSYEKLVRLCLARIEAYDQKGPELNSVILVNPAAIEEARALDAEFKAKGRRSPLHGIPVLVKDNFDTADMATTGGAFYLEGSLPPRDGYMIRRLREAGAIMIAKTNLDELAGGGTGFSSFWGQTKNPHGLDRIPAGSSGGTGAGLAAWFAPLGLGTDTGGSIRGPSAVNGVPGIKPTNGLLSRAGIIPRTLSFDTGGPMARSVYDVALSLGFMTGMDPDDPLTATSAGLFYTDYTPFLKKDALKGVRVGIMRAGLGKHAGADAIFEKAVADMRALGAVIVDPVAYPSFVTDANGALSDIIRAADVPGELDKYLATLKPGYPKTFAEMIALHDALKPKGRVQPNPRLYNAFKALDPEITLDSPIYRSAREHGMQMYRDAVLDTFIRHQLDVVVYCTRAEPAALISEAGGGTDRGTVSRGSLTSIANRSGFPDVIVPAGVTPIEKMPISISFFGPAYSEPRLLAYAYAYEQATKHLALPASTPALPGEKFTY
ncbi:amidase [Opitutales bacterium ASA1]|uniref:amidase family protein n=1 Tax=Congregicoccus parvus TaxID=3081749 RepID=UPI002B2C922A|nr:amidase [Opitutales bacterium ASA1]